MKLNLMLGVQNNNKDEIHQRINIQNCVKLAIKTFYFPSMKNIIFEVIYNIFLTKEMPIIYANSVVANLVESINLYGISIEKFKRILKMLLSSFFYDNVYFFIHDL